MVYEYTKPRAPIAAMFGSPGPCYGLPNLCGSNIHDPRSVHGKAPAYSFGIKHGKLSDDCSPGPCHMPNKKIYRDGADGTPHYSLYARYRELSQFKTPGPGAYSPEKAGPSSHHHHPAYPFGTRHKHRKSDNTPGKNLIVILLRVCIKFWNVLRLWGVSLAGQGHFQTFQPNSTPIGSCKLNAKTCFL